MHNVVIIGLGVVGTGLAEILHNKKQLLRKKYGFEYTVLGICDLIKGSIYDEQGLDLGDVLKLNKEKGKIEDYPCEQKGLSSVDMIKTPEVDIIAEVTPTNVKTGEPGLTHFRTALENKKHVVSTNKGPIALQYKELSALAEKNKVYLGFEGTVISGTPAINLGTKDLAGCDIKSARGILNGTTNYILTQMEEGRSYNEVLKEAQAKGYAETDPTADVEAYDPLAKIVILANAVMGGNVNINDVYREGITGITLEDVEKAKKEGKRIKLIGKAWRENGKVTAQVKPESLPMSDPLANVMGVLNAITFETDVTGDVTIIGPGAGGYTAGYAMVTDMLEINRRF
ncbi:MAG: homoserine dehydrogenase [Theionarchaea archaeon]|nr:MAG: homoserine dehydrogenase [Theionarchaea archaeon DG-70]MBU7012078.1 homoserine dehydrogenase [Theionarchaea archaeon]